MQRSRPEQLPRRDGELLLSVLELKTPLILGRFLAERGSEPGNTLKRLGVLVPGRCVRSYTLAEDEGLREIDLQWVEEKQADGYFHPFDRWVFPPPEHLQEYRLDLNWWLRWLATALDLTDAGRPFALVPELAWDIGNLWLSSTRKAPIIFARRLHIVANAKALVAALERRGGRKGGLILTSTARQVELDASCGHQLTVVSDLLTSDAEMFAIDPALIRAPYGGGPATQGSGVHCSPDGRTLTIAGEAFQFRGSKLPALIKRLADDHGRGVRTRTAELLEDFSPNVDTLRKALGPNQWPKIKGFVRQENGASWLAPFPDHT